MRPLPAAWLVAVLAILVGTLTPSSQSLNPVPPDVAARAAAGETVPIIVGVDTPFVPEGYLAGPAAVATQRDTMQAALDDVMARARAAGVDVGARFDYIPFFTATAGSAGLEALARMPGVRSIEPNQLARPGLNESVPQVNAPQAWASGAIGAGWTVAVLDTGVENTHDFLADKVIDEACYSTGAGAGGLSLCPGGVASSTAAGSALPCAITGCGHGTHVAGIVAGAGGMPPNPVFGVAPGASLIAMQVFSRFDEETDCGTGRAPCVLSWSSDQILALNRVFTLAGTNNENQIAAVNMSLGGGAFAATCDTQRQAVKTAIDNLRSIGIATVISAGNEGRTNEISAPACISTAISVGSTTKTNTMSTFSNRAAFLSLVAPGGDNVSAAGNITSSVPGNAFGAMAGTSMAAPHVAGAWAILKQVVPTASVTAVLAALRDTGILINDTAAGLVHRRIAISAARVALGGSPLQPGPPGTPTISGRGNTITFNWTPPVTGAPALWYSIVARTVAGGPIAVTLPVGNALSTTVTAPNGTFFITVVAGNASGSGPESEAVTLRVPLLATSVPGAPQGLSVSVAGQSATFGWSPPTTGGAVVGYTLLASTAAGAPPMVGIDVGAVTTIGFAGIAAGTYFVRVAAYNDRGTGPPSNEVSLTVTAPAAPGAPTLFPAVVTGQTVSLSWEPGPGDEPTSYVLTASATPAGAPLVRLTIRAQSAVFPGVPVGTYYVRVVAMNSVGASPPSNEVRVTVP